MFYYYDYTYLLLIPGIIIAAYAQMKISATYSKYSKIQNDRGITGREVARSILNNNGLSDVEVVSTSGKLTDHYDPKSKVIRLSSGVYDSSSVAAISIAAHECGHAIQDGEKYSALVIRNSIVPIVNLASSLSWILILAGFFFGLVGLIDLGIIFFSATVIFQLITLPVELNASKRALYQLDSLGLADGGDSVGAKKMLSAAAFTYLASLLVSILQLLRLVLIASNSRDWSYAGKNKDFSFKGS